MVPSALINIKSKSSGSRLNILKVFEWSATMLFFLAIILFIAGFFPISHPWITGKWVEMLKRSGGENCEISNVTITMWRGIVFTDFKFNKNIGNKERISFNAQKVVLSFNITVAIINYAQLVQSFDDIQNDWFYDLYKDPINRLRKTVHFFSSYDGFKRLLFDDVALSIYKSDSSVVSLNHGVADIIHEKENKFLDVEYQFGNFSFGQNNFENSKGIISIDDSSIKLSKARGSYFKGKYRASCEIDLKTLWLRTGQITFDEMDLASVLKVKKLSNGTITGTVDGNVEFKASSFHLDSLHGSGVLTFRNLYVSHLQVQESISSLLLIPQLTELRFDKVKNDFTFKKNLTFFNETQGTGYPLSLKSIGWIQFDGSLNQQIDGNLDAQLSKVLPSVIANSLEPGEKGERIFRCRVYGFLNAPLVELDSIILKRTVGSMFDDVRSNLINLFKKKSSN